MSKDSWNTLRRKTHDRAHGICEYCWTDEENIGLEMHVDHIHPGQGDVLENLALSCQRCNLAKAAATKAVDPDTGRTVPVFNPRTDDWHEHFEWRDDFSKVAGRTEKGRATVIRLRMNDLRTIRARIRWRNGGTHPPQLLIGSKPLEDS